MTQPAIHLLFKQLRWSQKRLAEKGVEFPRVGDDMLHSVGAETSCSQHINFHYVRSTLLHLVTLRSMTRRARFIQSDIII